jgi:hypothetical protein
VKKAYFVFFSLLFATSANAQNIATVNGKPISCKEFMWVYQKNHGGKSKASLQDMASYLNLYIDFKLKVVDAREMKLDTDTAYLTEVAGYEDALKKQKKISEKDPVYNFIINEYREGVLMFNVSEKKIWSKIQDSEADLHEFYEKNKSNYEGKSFNEVRGQVVSDFQQDQEATWIKGLRTKYTVKINNNELKKLAKP